MAGRRMGITVFLLWACLCLMPFTAMAASTADAKEPISPENECRLTLTYGYNGTAFSGHTVNLYEIAHVSADFQYTLTPSFASTGLALNGIRTNGEWNVIRSTLEAHILANNTVPVGMATADVSGQALFEQLKPGLYLASGVRVLRGNAVCTFDSALIAVPGLGTDGKWQYQVTAVPKARLIPINPDPGPTPKPDIRLNVLKLWNGDKGEQRPQSIQVEIFRNGVSDRLVTLSEENHWSYSWTTKEDGASWVVTERDVPDGYTMTVEERGTTFVLTNTRNTETPPGEVPPTEEPPTEEPPTEEPPTEEPPTEEPPTEEPPSEEPPDDSSSTREDPEDPTGEDHPTDESSSEDEPKDPTADVPKTGDTPHIMLFTVLMYVSGAVLVLLGLTGKRKRA